MADPSSSSDSSTFGVGDYATLGLGALGFGALLGKGESPLPSEFGQLTSTVPTLQASGQGVISQGGGLVTQGQEALGMAQRGELTPEQQAQLSVYSKGLTNQTRQQLYSMGIDPDKSTQGITLTADIDAKVNAMAQQQIQTTIQLGLGQISGGSGLIGQGLGFESAANQALITAGEAQLKQDQSYSQSLTAAFTAIGKMFGTVMAA